LGVSEAERGALALDEGEQGGGEPEEREDGEGDEGEERELRGELLHGWTMTAARRSRRGEVDERSR
jgi:hypothetical protein